MVAIAMSEFQHMTTSFFPCTPLLINTGKVNVLVVYHWLRLKTIGCPGGQEAKVNVQRMMCR